MKKKGPIMTVLTYAVAGILILAFSEYLFSKSFIIGFFVGIIICLADFISGYYDGFSLSEWLIEKIDDVMNKF